MALKAATIPGGAAIASSMTSCSSLTEVRPAATNYFELDAVLSQPVLKRKLFPDPVIIDSLELMRDRENTICRLRSKDGAEGVSIGHRSISQTSHPMFVYRLHYQFAGKDARDLDLLMLDAVERNIKKQGVQMAAIEFAILDMLGNVVNKPAGQLVGDVLNTAFPKAAN